MLLCDFFSEKEACLVRTLGLAEEDRGIKQTDTTAAMVLPSHSAPTSQSGSSTRVPSEELIKSLVSLYPSHGYIKVL